MEGEDGEEEETERQDETDKQGCRHKDGGMMDVRAGGWRDGGR